MKGPKYAMNAHVESARNWEGLAKEVNFKASGLARVCGVSLRTLQRHFKKNYNVTVREWLRGYRLRLAYGRLAEGQCIKEVAYDLGYKQLSHFSRDFKEAFGAAPRFFQHSARTRSETWENLRSRPLATVSLT